MGKYVIALLIGILIGNLLRRLIEKYWMDILIAILYVVMFVLIAPLYVITLPVRIINSITNAAASERKIVREYDRIFCEASTMEKVARINRKIRSVSRALEYKLKRKKEKEIKELLRETRWVI